MKIELTFDQEKEMVKIIKKIFNSFNPEDKDKYLNFIFQKILNPSAKRKTIYENIRLLPVLNEFEKENVKRLEEKGFIKIIFDKYILPKPLGIYAITNDLNIEQYDLYKIIDLYDTVLNKKIKSLIKANKKLPLKYLAPLVFLLYNNNISKGQGNFNLVTDLNVYHKNQEIPDELNDAIDRINYAFATQNIKAESTSRKNAGLSGYYLTEANLILGYPIENKWPHYFIKPNRIEDIEKIILETVKRQTKKALESFKAFELKFLDEQSILYKYGVYNATTDSKLRVKKLFEDV